MAITPAERKAILNLINGIDNEDGTHTDGLEDYLNDIVDAREDVFALLRIHESVDDDTKEDRILADAKTRVTTAAQNIVTLLTE